MSTEQKNPKRIVWLLGILAVMSQVALTKSNIGTEQIEKMNVTLKHDTGACWPFCPR